MLKKGLRNINTGLISMLPIIPAMGLLLALSSCDPESFNLSCENCYTIKPTEGILTIDLEPFNDGDSIPVKVYKGKLESGKLFLADTITRNYLDLWVPVGFFYTVVAEYEIDSTIIRAVDGDKVSVYLDETNCNEACWRARDGKADCRIKN